MSIEEAIQIVARILEPYRNSSSSVSVPTDALKVVLVAAMMTRGGSNKKGPRNG